MRGRVNKNCFDIIHISVSENLLIEIRTECVEHRRVGKVQESECTFYSQGFHALSTLSTTGGT